MAARPMRTDRLHRVRGTERDQAKSNKKRKPVKRMPRSAGTGEWAGRTAVRAPVKAAASKKQRGISRLRGRSDFEPERKIAKASSTTTAICNMMSSRESQL